MAHTYKKLVFTDHAWDRAQLRSIPADAIWLTVTQSQKKFKEANGFSKFIKTVNGRRLHVVAKKILPEENWLVISVWVRGEDDPVPLAWQLITLPFKILWLGLKFLGKRLMHIQ